MSSTIEVPISLIKTGDLDAIRDLLPKTNLLGRKATHPRYGRGIIISECPDQEGLLWFACEEKILPNGADWNQIPLDDLILDPVELVTVEDFEARQRAQSFPTRE
ncbi:hypothetical protein CU043_02000 [Corynebacterium striatum]|nr:hypothetical protein [Corynebacterium striatum]